MDLITMFENKRASQQEHDILSTLSESEREEFEERTAIMEYDGGLCYEYWKREEIYHDIVGVF